MGTPAVTTCGMKENELTQVGYLISEIMKNRSDENKLNEFRGRGQISCYEFSTIWLKQESI